ncbi:sulfatase-like hydrolase/transferase [Lacticaseibacillus daqingensis]|uniref:sulfatase-like hydrolase/transferase n=1 Tax=Lacticaseibacillus daqingensis TaxID=2486014 RepID=UPI000F7AB6E1|nr:sulfatase-like hydrolase/transferase [Lacticaseibacillus daqingensis]
MKRNVILMIADDQRFNTIHALGNPEIITPNFDQLVARGTSFTEAFIPGGSSGAVCMPSRAMLHTGRYVTSWEDDGDTIPDDQALLGEELQKGGYTSIGVGKWHNGTRAFARSFNDGGNIFFGGMWDHWNVPVNDYDPTGKYDHFKRFVQDPFSSKRIIDLPADRINIGKHSTDLFADTMIEKIHEHAEDDQPFFMYGAFMAPHDPRTMPSKYSALYDPDTISVPDNYLPQHPFEFDMRAQRDESLEAYPRPIAAVKRHIADYYAMITHIDDRVGDIVAALEETGQLDNTLIVYVADHGISLGQHGLMGKQNLYDNSIRIPMILAGPDIPVNHRVAGKALLLDMMPTILDYVGLPKPDGMFGHSLLPQIHGENAGRDAVYLQFTDKIRGVVTPDYKLIEYRTVQGSHTQLFDRHTDPLEEVDLAKTEAAQPIVAELRHQLRVMAAAQGDLAFSQGQDFWAREEK